MERRENASHDEVAPKIQLILQGGKEGWPLHALIQPVIGHEPALASDGDLGMPVPCS